MNLPADRLSSTKNSQIDALTEVILKLSASYTELFSTVTKHLDISVASRGARCCRCTYKSRLHSFLIKLKKSRVVKPGACQPQASACLVF